MTLFDWCAAAAGGWLILAALGGGSWAVVAASVKRRRSHWTDLELSQPPVPTQADIDATWLDAWPTDDADELHLRFDQIVSAEEWAS